MFYSLLITSCDRDDLLEKTVTTFMQSCDIQPRQIVIADNGPVRDMPEFLKKFRHLGLKWINEGRNRGQIYIADRLWNECKYDYAFWCEEDWQFNDSGYMQKSWEILEKYPEVLAVTLRGDWNHPLARDPRFPFLIAQPAWKGVWGGFTFNPGMRRKSDYKRIGSYGKHVGYGTTGLGHEIELSKLYQSMGYVLAALPNKCVHIGGGRSLAAGPSTITNPPKILIAIPACHKFDYGKWESSESPSYDRAKAWKGVPYGTDIHISGNNPRIQAVRDTWAKDVALYPNLTLKFFFGESDQCTDLPADSVYLRGVKDDYEHLPHKTIAICKWAQDNDFDYVFKCDDDTYVWVGQLLIEIMSQPFDFAGHINGGTCSGGPGYWLSRRAIDEVVRNPIKAHWAEDVTVGIIMKAAGIDPVHLTTHGVGGAQHWYDITSGIPDGTVAIHAVKSKDMYTIYKDTHERH